MGTQQLLLIVLGVIIVGIAIAVGITIFNNQAYNANRSAIASEVQMYGTDAMQWWKTPTSQGGAGKNPNNLSVENLSSYMNFDYTPGVDDDPDTPGNEYVAEIVGYLSTENGNYKVTAVDQNNITVTLVGIGKETRGTTYPKITATVNLEPGSITSVRGDASSLTDF